MAAEEFRKRVFYMVYAEGEKSPTIKHSRVEDAQMEAARLCILTGKKAYVLKAIRAFELSDVPLPKLNWDYNHNPEELIKRFYDLTTRE